MVLFFKDKKDTYKKAIQEVPKQLNTMQKKKNQKEETGTPSPETKNFLNLLFDMVHSEKVKEHWEREFTKEELEAKKKRRGKGK